jgi:hypothetical protein
MIHCGILLHFLYELYNDAKIHEHQMSNKINTLRTGNTFLSNVPRYPKERSFFEIPRLRLFFLVQRTKPKYL